jgi:hypothetical protein
MSETNNTPYQQNTSLHISRSKALLVFDHFKEIERLTTLCSKQVLEAAMSYAEVNDWVDALVKLDEVRKYKDVTNIRIVLEHKRDLSLFDSQSLLKIFVHRIWFLKDYFKDPSTLPEPYNVKEKKEKNDPSEEEKQVLYQNIILSDRFQSATKNLIDIRNDVSAHIGNADIESLLDLLTSEKGYEFIVELKSACQKMVEFLSFFPDECYKNESRSFYEMARNSLNQMNIDLQNTSHNVEKVILREKLEISVEEFLSICKELRLKYSFENDMHIFFTEDYNKDIIHIKSIIDKNNANKRAEEFIQNSKEKQKKNALILVIVFAFVTLLALVFTLGFFANNRPNDNNQTQPAGQTTINNEQSNNVDSSTTTPTTTTTTNPPAEYTKFKGEGSFDKLVFSIDQSATNVFNISYENGESTNYSLGWVSPPEIIIETTDGKYRGDFVGFIGTYKILTNSVGTFQVTVNEELTGKIKSITVNNVLILSSGGLPVGAGNIGQSIKIKVTYYE